MVSIDDLELFKISVADFKKLPEYTMTLPTGTFVGKRWKARTSRNRWSPYSGLVGSEYPERWIMGEYVDHPEPGQIGIEWRRLVIEG